MSMPGSTLKAWYFIESLRHTDEPRMSAIDPVCGKVADVTGAVGEAYRGWAHFFCSERCHGLFRASPEKYLGREWTGSVPSAETAERDDHGQD